MNCTWISNLLFLCILFCFVRLFVFPNWSLYKTSKHAIVIHDDILYSPILYYPKHIASKELISLIEIFTVIPGYSNQTVQSLSL